MRDELKSAADRFAARLKREKGIELAYDRAAIEWLDRYVEALRSRADLPRLTALSASIAAFLGECLVSRYGGSWQEVEGEWAVRLENGCFLFPFMALDDCFMDGKPHSLIEYYDALSLVLQG